MKIKQKTNVGKIIVTLVLFTLIFQLNMHSAIAANTNSIDLEAGTPNYLSISDGSQTGLDLSSNFTFEAWIKLESLPAADQQSKIISKYLRSGNQRSYLFHLDNPGGAGVRLSLVVSGNGTSVSSQSVNWTPSTGTWYHVAAAYDLAAGNAKFYVNGVQQGATQTGGNTAIYNGSATFEIGSNDGDEGATPDNFDGLIDDIRVWNTVRTETEISDDKSRELNGNESGLVSYWKLNSSLSDVVSGNTLTNNNSASFSSDVGFGAFTETLKVRKAANESVTNSTVLQNDDSLKLSLDVNKSYIVDGVIFASSTSATPDIVISFAGQSGSVIAIGYTNDSNEAVLGSGATSTRITLPANTPTSIHIKGTVKTSGTSGDFQLKWTQATSNAAATTVMEGSYLRAESI